MQTSTSSNPVFIADRMEALPYYFLLFLFSGTVECARILCVFPTASLSHQIAFQPIWRELSLRGHDVVTITTNPLNDPALTNLTEIDISYLYDHTRSIMTEVRTEKNHWEFLDIIKTFEATFFEGMFKSPQVVSMINDNNVNFDVVVAEFVMPAVTAFAYKYKCPFVGVTSLQLFTSVHDAVGNPAHPLLHPDLMSTFGEQLTFLEKIEAVVYAIVIRLKYYYQHVPTYDALVKKYLGNDIPYIGDLERNSSVVLTCTHPALHGARAYSPGVIEIGRMHIREKKPLPEVSDNAEDKVKGMWYFYYQQDIQI